MRLYFWNVDRQRNTSLLPRGLQHRRAPLISANHAVKPLQLLRQVQRDAHLFDFEHPRIHDRLPLYRRPALIAAKRIVHIHRRWEFIDLVSFRQRNLDPVRIFPRSFKLPRILPCFLLLQNVARFLPQNPRPLPEHDEKTDAVLMLSASLSVSLASGSPSSVSAG